jgi:hypothetical protein
VFDKEMPSVSAGHLTSLNQLSSLHVKKKYIKFVGPEMKQNAHLYKKQNN